MWQKISACFKEHGHVSPSAYLLLMSSSFTKHYQEMAAYSGKEIIVTWYKDSTTGRL
jgi:hypothetical protein